MNQRSDCIVCENKGREVMRNNLPMFVCDACGLFWRISFELDDNHYEQRGFELENKEKINARYANSLKRIDLFKKYADLNNACDIGSGEGVFLKALSERGYKNVIGLEPSVVARDYARENNLNIFEGDIENLDLSFFERNNIHTVTMFHVIEHLKNPKDALKAIYDNLKKGDSLIIETPDTESRIFINTNYQNEFVYPEHLYYFNRNNIKKLLEDVGFKIVVIGSRDFDPENMSIRESLARLGFGENKNKLVIENTKKGNVVQKREINDSLIKKFVRTILSRLVLLLNRGNYLWVIAKK